MRASLPPASETAGCLRPECPLLNRARSAPTAAAPRDFRACVCGCAQLKPNDASSVGSAGGAGAAAVTCTSRTPSPPDAQRHSVTGVDASRAGAPVVGRVRSPATDCFDHSDAWILPAAAPKGSTALTTTPVAPPVADAIGGESDRRAMRRSPVAPAPRICPIARKITAAGSIAVGCCRPRRRRRVRHRVCEDERSSAIAVGAERPQLSRPEWTETGNSPPMKTGRSSTAVPHRQRPRYRG